MMSRGGLEPPSLLLISTENISFLVLTFKEGMKKGETELCLAFMVKHCNDLLPMIIPAVVIPPVREVSIAWNGDGDRGGCRSR